MTATGRPLNTIAPVVRKWIACGVDPDYLDDFLDRNCFEGEAVIAQNLGPVLPRIQAANRPFAPD